MRAPSFCSSIIHGLVHVVAAAVAATAAIVTTTGAQKGQAPLRLINM